MDFDNVWTIASKDFSIFFRKKNILIPVVLLHLLASIGFSLILYYVIDQSFFRISNLPALTDAFTFFFLLIIGPIPVGIGSYSFVGEKIEKTFEPLLASPATDNEILLGKCLVTFLPTIIGLFISLPVFAFLVDIFTVQKYGSFILPNEKFWIIFLLDIPLADLLSVELVVLISIIANDARIATQYGTLIVLPYGAIYVLIEIDKLTLNQQTLYEISGVIFISILILLFLIKKSFHREEILARWKT